jgi:hypothetical protein
MSDNFKTAEQHNAEYGVGESKFTPRRGDEAFREALRRHKSNHDEKRDAIPAAHDALVRLVEVCSHKTGQGCKIRSLLYSLWNGQPTSLLEIVALDWELRKDLHAVMLPFGHADFFYDHIKAAFAARGLFDWFIDEGKTPETN